MHHAWHSMHSAGPAITACSAACCGREMLVNHPQARRLCIERLLAVSQMLIGPTRQCPFYAGIHRKCWTSPPACEPVGAGGWHLQDHQAAPTSPAGCCHMPPLLQWLSWLLSLVSPIPAATSTAGAPLTGAERTPPSPPSACMHSSVATRRATTSCTCACHRYVSSLRVFCFDSVCLQEIVRTVGPGSPLASTLSNHMLHFIAAPSQEVVHTIGPGSPLASWLEPGGLSEDADSEIVVVVSPTVEWIFWAVIGSCALA